MSGFVQNLLQDAAPIVKKELNNAVQAAFGTEYLRDFQHASKTFRTNSYQYSPKFKFLFHVYFDLNTELISSLKNFPSDANFGLTVKNIQLPKYTFDTHTLNQYNRKRVVQTKIRYNDININFHDDNGNLLRKLWYAYYTYYYKDAVQQDATILTSSQEITKTDNSGGSVTTRQLSDLNRRNIYDTSISGNDDWGYIGETSDTQCTPLAATLGASKAPFFKGINIFGFNQHKFVMYRLINPMITGFGHDTYDYAQGGGVMENQMTVSYETVKYYEGAIDGRTPDNIAKMQFGEASTYDRTLSPIAKPGSQATILGQGGLVSAAGGILDDIESRNYLGAIKKAGTAYNTFKNPQTLVNAAKSEVLNAANQAITGAPNSSTSQYFPTFGSSSTNRNTSTTSNGANTGKKQPTTVSTY